ncbi:MAG: OmpA family protein [Salibacteraceae bacterium]
MIDFRILILIALIPVSQLFGQHQEVKSLSKSQLKKQYKGAERANDHYSQIDFLEELILRKPENLKYKYQLARAYDESRNYQRALEEYSKVFYADQEKYAVAIYHMGRIMKHRKQYRLARLYFNQFLEKHNHSKEAKYYKKRVKMELMGCEMGLTKDPENEPKATIKPLTGNINKSNIEFSPVILDNKTFLYVSLPSDDVVFLESDSMPLRRVYIASLAQDNWQMQSKFEHPANNSEEHIGSFSLSQDKQRMYFTLCSPNWQNRVTCKIYQSKQENGEWSEPVLLPEEVMSSNHTFTQPSVGSSTKQGREIIYFVSDRKGGKGGYDIWYTRYRIEKDRFEKARNAGSKVNTLGDELAPTFDFTSHKLYFSSDGHASLGGFDIFETIGERSRWMNKAVNSGKQINSPYDEFYYSPFPGDPKKALLVSNREGSISHKHAHCCDDIFEVTWKNQVILNYKLTLTDYETKKNIPNSNVLISVKDSPEGEILILQRIKSDSLGKVNFNLDPSLDYEIIIESEKHFNFEFPINARKIERSTNVSKKISLTPIPEGEIIIPNIYYPFDKAYLTPEAQLAIDTSIYKTLVENPLLIIEISSHTDSKGTDKYNEQLSQRRAESVVNYLLEKGINKKRLSAKGYGEGSPIVSNTNQDGTDNPTNRARNRRTAFRIIGQLDVDIYYEEE